MNIADFLKAMKNSQITGEFDLSDHKDELMDRDFEGTTFKDCVITGGDFASSGFNNCTFENVTFDGSALVGVTFQGCTMNNLAFTQTQTDFSIS
ncbi:pentapeptide repeat-containing protein [Patescibacteria group bacterium]